MTPCLFAPGSHSNHNGFCFSKFFTGSASTCSPPAFRCRELSWPFFSSRLVPLLALRILDRNPRTELCLILRFFNLSFFAVSQVCWAHLFWLSCGEPLTFFFGLFRVISRFMGTCTFSLSLRGYCSALRRCFATSLSPGKQILLLLLYLEFFTAFFSPVGSGCSVCLLVAFAVLSLEIFLRFTQLYCKVSCFVYWFVAVWFICRLHVLSGRFFHATLAIGALQMLEFCTCCTRCSCHRGLAGACGDTFMFICMLLLPSGLCRCLNLLYTLLWPSGLCRCLWLQVCVYLRASLAIGALQVLVVKGLYLFACCS